MQDVAERLMATALHSSEWDVDGVADLIASSTVAFGASMPDAIMEGTASSRKLASIEDLIIEVLDSTS